MTNTEWLLIFIAFMHVTIWIYIRLIWLSITKALDPKQSVNQYGESFVDAIQNAHVRGLRGISTWE